MWPPAALEFLRELEEAVARGTPESRKRALWHTTDVMITGRYSDDEIWTFGAVFLFVLTSAFAQEQEKPPARSISPDGKWQFRAAAAGEQEDFVIAKAGSDESSLVLSEEEYADGLAEALSRAPSYANIVWGPDSKRFAFNLQPGKAYQTVQFYQFDGNTWRKLDSLESNDATFEPLDRSMARQKQKLKLPSPDAGWSVVNSWQVRKWIRLKHRAVVLPQSKKTPKGKIVLAE